MKDFIIRTYRALRAPAAACFVLAASIVGMGALVAIPDVAHARSLAHPIAKHATLEELVPDIDTRPIIFNSLELDPEQSAVVRWIMNQTKPAVSESFAAKIVVKVYEQAQAFRLDPMMAIAVMRLESRFNPNAVSSAGAKGLMQVLPKFHKDKLAGENPFNVDTSIRVGTQILADCLDDHDGNVFKAMNCYSGGGGKAYYELYRSFHHDSNHYLVHALFDPEVTETARGDDEFVWRRPALIKMLR